MRPAAPAMFTLLAGVALAVWLGVPAHSAESPIRFSLQTAGFPLESCETPERHAPETMAGGWPCSTTIAMATWTCSSPMAPTSRH